VLFSDRVGRAGWVAVVLSAVGVALLAQAGPTSLSPGSLLTLGGAVCFAGHIAGLSQWASPGNAYGLTAWSVAVATLLSGTAALVGNGLTVPPAVATWQAVAYLALAATCLGFVVQAWAQSALSATTAAVVMTMEPVFAAVLAVIIGGEALHHTGWLGGEALHHTGWLGGVLVVTSMFVAELGPRDCCDALAPRIECC
jgi:drug/metabolite transporter (DMT)-like permease